MKKLFLFPVAVGITISSMAFYGCGNAAEKKQDDGGVAPVDTSKGVSAMAHDSLHGGDIVYICPCGGCPEVKESQSGNCSKCGMELVQEK